MGHPQRQIRPIRPIQIKEPSYVLNHPVCVRKFFKNSQLNPHIENLNFKFKMQHQGEHKIQVLMMNYSDSSSVCFIQIFFAKFHSFRLFPLHNIIR